MAESKKSAAEAAALDILGFSIDSEETALAKAAPIPEGTRILLPRGEIIPWELNPRRHYDEAELSELGNDIKNEGQINDLLVRPYPEKPGFYQLLGGERRWRSTAPEFADVPLLWVKVFNVEDDAKALDIAWKDNVHRKDLTAMENANYARMRRQMARDRGEKDTLHVLAAASGMTYERVRQIESVLKLPEYILDLFDALGLNEKHARGLLLLADYPDEQRSLFRQVERAGASNFSGNATEKRARQMRAQAEKDAAESEPKAPGLFDDDEVEAEATPPSVSSGTSTRSVELEANATSSQPAQTGNADDGELENDNWRSDARAQNAGQGGVAASAPAGQGSGFATVPEAGAVAQRGARQEPLASNDDLVKNLRTIRRYYEVSPSVGERFDSEVQSAITAIEEELAALKKARSTKLK